MEPKLIKEEVPDRDNGSSSCISNSKELSRGGRQSTPPTHPEGGGGPVSRTPKAKGKSLSLTAVQFCFRKYVVGTETRDVISRLMLTFASAFTHQARACLDGGSESLHASRTCSLDRPIAGSVPYRGKNKQRLAVLDGEKNSCLKHCSS